MEKTISQAHENVKKSHGGTRPILSGAQKRADQDAESWDEMASDETPNDQ
jgi:hypothetical protein